MPESREAVNIPHTLTVDGGRVPCVVVDKQARSRWYYLVVQPSLGIGNQKGRPDLSAASVLVGKKTYEKALVGDSMVFSFKGTASFD